MKPETGRRDRRDRNRTPQPARPGKTPPQKERPQLSLATGNYVLMAVALFTIVIGFVTLSQGSITLAPVLLVLGYCVLVPLSLLLNFRRQPRRTDVTPTGSPAGPAQPETKPGEK